MRPGLLSAVGLLGADRRGDFSVMRSLTVTDENLPTFKEGIAILKDRGAKWCVAEGLELHDPTTEHAVDLRYQGQYFKIS